MRSFNNRVAVVTGAGSGIGQALAIELAKYGCTLALADKNVEGMETTRAMILKQGGQCSTHELDVSDLESVKQFYDDVVKEWGQVHLLFNNAGVTLIDTVARQSIDSIKWLMNINFWGVVNCTQTFLPHLLQADDAHIINVSSIFGVISVPRQSAYNASKFAVRGYTDALRQEHLESNLNVTCVMPGGVRTGIVDNSKVNPDALGAGESKSNIAKNFATRVKTTPEMAAQQILQAILNNRPRVLVGRDAKMMDFVGRLFPQSYDKMLGIRKKFKQAG